VRLGRIGYVNCFPVYGAIDRGVVPVAAELVTGTPSELNGLLAAGALDISVVSAVEYAREADQYVLLPGLAISSDGPVRSVMLFSEQPAPELDGATILVSASSRTSVHLLELLCHDRWGVHPQLVEARTEPGDLEALRHLPHAGVLVIGDGALLLAHETRYPHRYDLGQEWKAWTGLPFVFAVWAARRSVSRRATEAVHRALMESKQWGLGNLPALADEAARQTGLSVAECEEYFAGLDFGLSYAHLEGLTSFLRRLAARGAVRDGTLRFLAVA